MWHSVPDYRERLELLVIQPITLCQYAKIIKLFLMQQKIEAKSHIIVAQHIHLQENKFYGIQEILKAEQTDHCDTENQRQVEGSLNYFRLLINIYYNSVFLLFLFSLCASSFLAYASSLSFLPWNQKQKVRILVGNKLGKYIGNKYHLKMPNFIIITTSIMLADEHYISLIMVAAKYFKFHTLVLL